MNITFTLPRGHALGSFNMELPYPPLPGHVVRYEGTVYPVVSVVWDLKVPVWVVVQLA